MAGADKNVQRAAMVSLVATIVVVAVKLIAAALSHSVSVLAEGLQSTIDILIAALAIWTVRYAAKPPDEDHPYGHGKAELLASALQMVIVLLSSGYILRECWQRFAQPVEISWSYGAIAMVYATLSNLVVMTFLNKVAQERHSEVLRSESQHLRTDTIASIGVLIGLLLVSVTGNKIIDPIVGAICATIGIVLAMKQIVRVVHPLMDGALPEAELEVLRQVLSENMYVRGFHDVRTRKLGNTRVIELHVMLDDHLTFVRAHEITEEIEGELRTALKARFVSIHYEPYEAEMIHRNHEHSTGAKP